MKEELIDFVGESWRLYHSKKQRPMNSMRIIRTIAQDGWRPVSAPPLSMDPETLAAEKAQLVFFSYLIPSLIVFRGQQ